MLKDVVGDIGLSIESPSPVWTSMKEEDSGALTRATAALPRHHPSLLTDPATELQASKCGRQGELYPGDSS